MTAKAGVFISIKSALTDDRGFKKTNANLRTMQGEARQSSRAVETSSARSNKALGTLTGGFAATGRASKLMNLAVGGGAALAGAAIVGFAMKSSKAYLDTVKSAREFQRVAGGTAEQASQLAFATRRMGLAPEAAAKAFGQLSKRLGAGQVDLHKYGIDVRKNADGSLDMKDAVLKLSGALSKMDANKRTATVFELFGRQGQALLPLLTKNRHELEQIFELAGKDHQIFSQKDFDQAVEYQKSLAELQLAWQGLEVQIGHAALPVLQGAVDLLDPLATLVADNADAATFLAKVVGGPLLLALTAITAVKLGSWFIEGGAAALAFGSRILELVGTLGTGTVAMEGFGATAEATAATVGTSAGGMGAALAAGAAGLTDLLIAVGTQNPAMLAALVAQVIPDSSRVETEWKKINKTETASLSQSYANARKAGHGYEWLKWSLAGYRQEQTRLRRELDKKPDMHGLDFFTGNDHGSGKIIHQLRTVEARLDITRKFMKAFALDAKAAGGQVRDSFVEIAGLHVPNDLLAGLDSKQLKSFNTDLQTSVQVFGAWSTQMLLNSGIGVDALKALTKEAQQTDAQIESSFRSATTVVGAFGNDTTITGDQFMKKLQDMNASAHDFANKLAIAAAVGVDQGLLKSIAEAGPKAAPELDALLQAVHTNGVQAINDTQKDTDSALAAIQGTINGRIAGDAATGYAYGTAVGNALGMGLAAAAGRAVDNALRDLMGRVGRLFGGGGGGGGGASGTKTALGGSRKAGQIVWAGEVGPEAMVMPANGQWLSHAEAYAAVRDAASAARAPIGGSAVSGGNAGGASIVIQVDARGATDPAATEAAAKRGAHAGSQTAVRQLTVLARGK